MGNLQNDQLVQLGTASGSLLYELQLIWDEVGEPDDERDKTLLELEQECLEVYRRKVDQANRARAHLRKDIADSEAEIAAICSAMGERPVHLRQPNHNARSLKEELKEIIPQLEEMRKRKTERRNQFLEVIEHIQRITTELKPTDGTSKISVDESDLSMRSLEELNNHLQSLQKEKNDRLTQVMDHLNTLRSLCLVLGLDFKHTVSEVHPSLDTEGSKCISNDTIQSLVSLIRRLREVKIQRMQKLQDHATTMLELWNLMDTPIEEQQLFQNVTCNVAASEHEITEPNTLSLEFINYVGEEVSRLEELKASKMKELVFKKMTELEELRHRTHLVAEANSEAEFVINAMESGVLDPPLVLEQIESQISCIKEEAFSRKEVLERVEKWLAACGEESWLEEYNRDENRYSAGKGAHLILKRAEKARAIVSKLQGIVEALTTKITAWERERGINFTYDGVHLLSMVEEYIIVRQEKEEERRRQRDQKKLQGQLIAEQEARFGSKPSPLKPQSVKKMPRNSMGSATRRLSLGGGAVTHTPSRPDPPSSVKSARSTKRADELANISPRRRHTDIPGHPAKRLPFNAINARDGHIFREPFTLLVPVNGFQRTSPQNISLEPKLNNKLQATMQAICPQTPIATCVAPMQVATTPAPPCFVHESAAPTVVPDIEYSFEEKRLEFYSKS